MVLNLHFLQFDNHIYREDGLFVLLVHVVDISHTEFEDQIKTVTQTLTEIGAGDKKVIMVFNKMDAYRWTQKDEDDLLPSTKENISLVDLKNSWMAKDNHPCIFLSAKTKENFTAFKDLLYQNIREIHAVRYPYNDYLY